MQPLDPRVNDEELQQGVSRSRIGLVRWWLYDTYEDVDADLYKLDKETDIVGPFTKFKCGTTLEKPRASDKQKIIPWDHELHLFKDLTARANKTGKQIDITRQDVLNKIPLVKAFLELIPRLFHEDIQNELGSRVTTAMGNLVVNDDPVDLSLILCVMAIAILYTSQIDSKLLDSAIGYRNKASSIMEQLNWNNTLQLVLMIMINTTLGVYDPALFTEESVNPLMSQYYEFFQSTNILINPSQYHFDSKFKKVYADMLDPKYNLLRNLKEAVRTQMKDPLGKIDIKSRETPKDQIIKIPRHIEEVEDDNEPAPPTFTIHFSNDENDNNDNEQDDNDNNDDDGGAYGHSMEDLGAIFEMDVQTREKSVYGVTRSLISLYSHLCQLVNHKRYFVRVQMNSRNFAMVCAEFEDILLRKSVQMCHTPRDQQWHHMLLMIYFRCVKNYPRSRLNFHHARAMEFDDGSQSSSFVHTLLGHDNKILGPVWNNNWRLKEWISKHLDKDWVYEQHKPENIFTL